MIYLMAIITVVPTQFRNVKMQLYPLDTTYLQCKLEESVSALLQQGKHIKNTERQQTVKLMEKELVGETRFMKYFLVNITLYLTSTEK